eukprot:4323121-Karenia_brevis.AAC.1
MDGSWQSVGRRRKARPGQSALERAVAAALFSSGRSVSQLRGRGQQWSCGTCGWQNDLKRTVCRHCAARKTSSATEQTSAVPGGAQSNTRKSARSITTPMQ